MFKAKNLVRQNNEEKNVATVLEEKIF